MIYYDYYGDLYPLYFETSWWKHLKIKLIYSNKRAKCWICEKTNTLLIHHELYIHLFHEKLFKDVFLLCFDCHRSLHFVKVLWFTEKKISLAYKSLKRRRLFMRTRYLLKKRRFASAILVFFRYIFCV